MWAPYRTGPASPPDGCCRFNQCRSEVDVITRRRRRRRAQGRSSPGRMKRIWRMMKAAVQQWQPRITTYTKHASVQQWTTPRVNRVIMSLALHYWMGDVGLHHCSRAPVSEMTYTVSSGTLNATIPHHIIPTVVLLVLRVILYSLYYILTYLFTYLL